MIEKSAKANIQFKNLLILIVYTSPKLLRTKKQRQTAKTTLFDTHLYCIKAATSQPLKVNLTWKLLPKLLTRFCVLVILMDLTESILYFVVLIIRFIYDT